jgi:hypothetical protein
MKCGIPCKDVRVARLPLDRLASHLHSEPMRHITILIRFFSTILPLFARLNPHQRLREALALEKQGQFDSAINMTKLVIDSKAGVEGGVNCGGGCGVSGCSGTVRANPRRTALVNRMGAHAPRQSMRSIRRHKQIIGGYAGEPSRFSITRLAVEIRSISWRR